MRLVTHDFRTCCVSPVNHLEGNLISRKSTKKSSNVEKYARDCFILYMYLKGDSSSIDEVFDKSKVKQDQGLGLLPTISLVELRTLTQSLAERVATLEKSHKELANLRAEVKTLRTENAQLKSTADALKGELSSKVKQFDAFKKLTSDRLKDVEGFNFDVYQASHAHTGSEITRLSKLCSGLQKQIADTKVKKSYASVTSGSSKATNVTPMKDHGSVQASSPAPSTASTTPSSLIDVSALESTRLSHDQTYGSGNDSSYTEYATEEYHPENPERTGVKMNPQQSSDESDIFIGVTYKRNARYYLWGINRRSTESGIKRYVENKGVHVSHLTLFKPRNSKSLLSAKVNISPEDAHIVERKRFWPNGVKFRKWYSVRDWTERCNRPQQNYVAEDWDNDGYEVD